MLVDLINNIGTLAEEQNSLLRNIKQKVAQMEIERLQHAVSLYANMKTKKVFVELIRNTTEYAA